MAVARWTQRGKAFYAKPNAIDVRRMPPDAPGALRGWGGWGHRAAVARVTGKLSLGGKSKNDGLRDRLHITPPRRYIHVVCRFETRCDATVVILPSREVQKGSWS